jgi:protein gp37
MTEAATWPDLFDTRRKDKPWLDGLPRLIFDSDMSDALSLDVTFEFLKKEVAEVAASPEGSRHRWLWLTKRPQRMAEFSRWLADQGDAWPQNIWAGTSITTQETTSRIGHLLEVGSDDTTRFLSVEPQYGPVILGEWLPRLDWVIQGGESGRDAHPFNLSWALELLDLCRRHGACYFLKQLGSHVVKNGDRLRFIDSHAGDWSEWPRELRVREVPGMANADRSEPAEATSGKKKSKAALTAIAKKAWETRRRNAAPGAASEDCADQAKAKTLPSVDLERLQRAKEFVLACGGIGNAIAAIEERMRLQIDK